MIGLSLSFVSKHNMWSCYDWVYCCCRPSVNTICGHVMIGLSLLLTTTTTTQSKYDHILCLLTDDNNDNPIIIRPHIVFTAGRQQQPNHNTTTSLCSSVNTICGRIMIGLSLLPFVSKHTMLSYYKWVCCCCRSSVNTICGRIIVGLSL
jgi:hypothetical protein